MNGTKLTFQLTKADLVAFNEYHSEHSPLHKKLRRRHRTLVPAVYLLLAIMFCFFAEFSGAVIFFGLAIAWFFLSPHWQKRRYRNHFRKHIDETAGEALKEPVTLELREDGIHSKSYLGESVFNYAAVGDIAVSGIYTYVYIGKGMAIILPEDRLPKEQIDAFIEELKTRLNLPESA